jgi:hypothetical protein
MRIPPVAQPPAASAASQVSRAVATSVVTPQAVSASILQRAVGDGDGRTGAAALNDGDAAAHAAAQYVQAAGHSVDVKV